MPRLPVDLRRPSPPSVPAALLDPTFRAPLSVARAAARDFGVPRLLQASRITPNSRVVGLTTRTSASLQPRESPPDAVRRRVMQNPVEDRGRDHTVPEDIAPAPEALVAGHNHPPEAMALSTDQMSGPGPSCRVQAGTPPLSGAPPRSPDRRHPKALCFPRPPGPPICPRHSQITRPRKTENTCAPYTTLTSPRSAGHRDPPSASGASYDFAHG